MMEICSHIAPFRNYSCSQIEYSFSSETSSLHLTHIPLTYISESQAAPSGKCSHCSIAVSWQIFSGEGLALAPSFLAL